MIEELARHTGVEVQEADAQFEQELSGLPLAQKRTSRNKAYVYVLGEEILKGPYRPQSLKLINNLRYPYLIAYLEEALRLPDCYRGVFRWRRLLFSPSGEERTYYVAGENVGRHEDMRVQPGSTQVDSDFLVAERGTFVKRVSEIEKVKKGARYERHPDFDERVAVASLQHLYFRHLLNIGDSGTHNILVRQGRETSGRSIAGIDFDEHRSGQERRTALGYFFKKEDAYLEEVYGEYLGRIVLLDDVDEALKRAIDELNIIYSKWVRSFQPTSSRFEHLSESTIRVQDVLERNERIRSLMCTRGFIG